MFIELKKKTYNELIDLLKSLEKFELIKSLENGADDDYVPPVVNKKEIYSEDEGSAEEESLSGVTIDKNGLLSRK